MSQKSLPKFTDSTSKFEILLQKDRITTEDLDNTLNPTERVEFGKFMTDNLTPRRGWKEI